MTASPWTADRIDRLKTLWLEGRSAETIARDLAHGITRSAVLGKVHRMGLSAGRAAKPVKRDPPARTPSEPVWRRPVARLAVPEAAPLPESGLSSLLSVGRHDCRWPIGDPLAAGFSLCGRRVVRGAYCEAHADVGYRRACETPQSLERLVRLN